MRSVRRIGLLAGSFSVVAGLALLPWAAGAAPASASTTPAKHPPTHLTRPPGGVLVHGPRMYNPATGGLLRQRSEVSVSLVRGLANQVVEVRWTGFTPSNESLDSGAPGYDSDNTQYPVMVIECPGRHPKNPGQCPGGENGGTDATVTVFGPQNAAFATTQANGTGQAPIELLTAEQAPELGCDQGKPCSVVIMPSQGGAPDGCSDHSQDGQTDGPGTGAWDFGTNYQCAWAKRIVVPLSFAPTPSDCPVRTPDFSVIGSAMVGRAMESWQAALCQGSNPVSIQYYSAQG
jgi:hypothetical protein